jgi:tetratricopeptide (TPR) repeat protein
VIASLLASLGKIGTDSLLLFSAFNNHPDPRVRANMIHSMITCGGKAVSYFTQGLKDPSPRVRSASARNLFLLGQLDIIPTLNRMLLIPSPVSVLSACHALGQLLRIQPPVLDTDHPLPLAISRKVRIQRKTEQNISGLLSGLELPDVFKEMAIASGDRKKSLWILEEKSRRFPSSHVVKRMLSAFCTMDGQFDKALSLLEICLSEHPCILADLLDAYRLSLKTGNLEKATEYGNRTKALYKELLDGCMALCRSLHGNGADLMLERLHHLSEPSMNLYNAMIQIKVLEGDKETIIDLLSELAISRPNNIFVIRKLLSIIPESYSELAEALQVYSSSFGDY